MWHMTDAPLLPPLKRSASVVKLDDVIPDEVTNSSYIEVFFYTVMILEISIRHITAMT